MPPEKLVLLKSRSQRLAEMLIIPAVMLPVGPILRVFLGTSYSFFYGAVAALVLTMVVTALCTQWAIRHGEWVTKVERLHRLVEEAATSRWSNAAAMMMGVALILIALFLTMDPIDRFGADIGGAPNTLALIAVLSLMAGVPSLFSRRQQPKSVVTENASPGDTYWQELRRRLPWTYLAYALGAATGTAIGLQFQGPAQLLASLVGSLVPALLLQQLFFLWKSPAKLNPTIFDAKLGRQLVAGMLLWGVPFGILFSVVWALDSIDRPAHMALGIAITMAISIPGGLFFGASIYLVKRLENPEQSRRD